MRRALCERLVEDAILAFSEDPEAFSQSDEATRDDFVALAFSALDHGGVDLRTQRKVAEALGVSLCRRCSGPIPEDDHPGDEVRDSGVRADGAYCSWQCCCDADDAAREGSGR